MLRWLMPATAYIKNESNISPIETGPGTDPRRAAWRPAVLLSAARTPPAPARPCWCS